MPKMNPEAKAKWCKALRSGEYFQGEGQLKDGGLYCCLGVARDLFYPKNWAGTGIDDLVLRADEAEPIGLVGNVDTDSYDELMGIQDWLAQMNDGGKSFNEIADWIEETL